MRELLIALSLDDSLFVHIGHSTGGGVGIGYAALHPVMAGNRTFVSPASRHASPIAHALHAMTQFDSWPLQGVVGLCLVDAVSSWHLNPGYWRESITRIVRL